MKTSKENLISLTQIRGLLKEITFNPKKSGPMNVIIDSGNPDYFETRAHELIEEAKIERISGSVTIEMAKNTTYEEIEEPRVRWAYKKKLIKAIQMLILAILKS